MTLPDWLTNIDETIETEEKAEDLDAISNGIRDNYMWPLLALGVPGNVLTIITLVTMGKMTPGAFFIAILAASDLAALITKFIRLQIDIHNVYMGHLGCKMQFLPIYFSTLANWTLAFIALERFISVCYPLQKAYLFTKRRSYIAAAVLIFSFLILLTPLFAVIYTSTSNGYACGVEKQYHFFWTKIWYWINACLVIFIPFVVSLAFTICIIRGLHLSRKDRQSILGKSDSGSRTGKNTNSKLLKETEKTERMLTIMLILATVIFLVLALPACVYFLAMKDEYEDSLEEARWNLFNQIQYMLFDTSHAVNFFLYFLSARRFRTHFILILTCKKPWKPGHYETSSHTDSSVISMSSAKV